MIAFAITMVLLLVVVFIFFKSKNDNESQEPTLKETQKKVDNFDHNVTFANPQQAFEAIYKSDFLIIDTRSQQEFSEKHIENSINIPLLEIFEGKNQELLSKEKTLILVESQETLDGKKVASNLKEKGYKINYLKGGLHNYTEIGYTVISFGDPTSAQDRAKVSLMNLNDLGQRLLNGERFVYLDVRPAFEFQKDHFQNATNIPLEKLEKNKKDVPSGKILIIDENPFRSFQAAVRLHDMNFLTVYYLSNSYSEFKKAVQEKTLLQ